MGASINTTAVLKPTRNGVKEIVNLNEYNKIFFSRQWSLPLSISLSHTHKYTSLYTYKTMQFGVKQNKPKIKSWITSLCQSNCVCVCVEPANYHYSCVEYLCLHCVHASSFMSLVCVCVMHLKTIYFSIYAFQINEESNQKSKTFLFCTCLFFLSFILSFNFILWWNSVCMC